MNLLLQDPYQYLDAFMLIFVRITGMLLIMPFLSNRAIPAMAKITIAFFTAVIMINIVPVAGDYSSVYPIEFAVFVLKEFITGWMIGFSAYFVFAILTLAGQFIDYQIGFSMVNVFDPLSQTQITITGNFYYFLFLLIFLLTRSYGYVFKGIKESFSYIPLGQFTLTNYLFDSFTDYFTTFFVIALQISAPVFFVMLVTNIVLGVLARTVPQLNMFVIGFPLKILLGLVVMYLTMFLFSNISHMLINEFIHLMDRFIRGMVPS